MGRPVTDADLPITTERLVLRRFRASDTEPVLALYSDPGVTRYLYKEPLGLDGLEQVMLRRLNEPRLAVEGDVLDLAAELRSTGELVGAFVLFHRSDANRRGEIGYTLFPKFTGRGLATEGGRALLRIAFELLGLHSVVATCDARTFASTQVMARLGMRQEAHFRRNVFVKGEWTDELVFALLAEEWRATVARSGG